MHSAERYRQLAAQARRLAETITNLEVLEQIERTAAEYDEMADKLERQTNGKAPPKLSIVP